MCGIITVHDLQEIKIFVSHQEGGLSMVHAREVMNSKPIFVSEGTSVKDCVKILLENNISGVPVVNNDNKVIGIVTVTDLIDKELHFHLPGIISFFKQSSLSSRSKRAENKYQSIVNYNVNEVMTKNVISVMEDVDVDEVIEIIVENNINMVPVISKDKRLIGIISRSDILDFLISRNDDKIRKSNKPGCCE